ncbi:MAG: hypothetical protein PHG53_09580 [Phycisphaerae bacterium]|nr:hypothetical protein [Phycisphaerae bacterium]
MKIKYQNYKGRRSDSIGDNSIYTEEESIFLARVEHFRTTENRNQTPTVTQIFRLAKEFLGVTVLLVFLCLTAQADCITDGKDLKAIHQRWTKPYNLRDYAFLANNWQKRDPLCEMQRNYFRVQEIRFLNPWDFSVMMSKMGGFIKYQRIRNDVTKSVGTNLTNIGVYK